MITALVCTRNRGEGVLETVRSILANDHPQMELIVVDQSTNEETATVLEPLSTDVRLRYLRTQTVGKTVALNLGLQEAHGEVVAITDDDCIVPANWLTEMEQIFTEHPKVAVAFCNVSAVPYDSSQGFIPAYQRQGCQLVTTLCGKISARGIGAGIALRRSVVQELGGFDLALGPGGRFPDCDDGDIAVRALLKGYHIFETDRVAVLHAGFRTYQEGRELSRRNWLGIGAAYSKPLKCGYWRFWIIPAYEFFGVALWPVLRALLTLKKPRGVTGVVAFWQGFVQGWRTPVEKEKILFVVSGKSEKR